MELNTEINKIFGEQMAQLFASKISEEELEKASKDAWKNITDRPISWGNKNLSCLDELIRDELIKRLLSVIQSLMKETVTEEWIKKESEIITKEAKEKAHELIVETIAENIKNSVFFNYNVDYSINNGCEKISQAIINHR